MADDTGVQLTADGVRALRSERPLDDDAPLTLQVVDVYRYLVDPALKQLLSGTDVGKELDRDMFDLVLSDGKLKTKCILSPALNHLIWRGQVARFDMLRITDCSVVRVEVASGEDGDAVTRPVWVIQSCEVVKRQSDKFLVYVSSSTPPHEASSLVEEDMGDDLAFASTVNERETELIPVAGERLYYLPLNSDHYTLNTAPRTAAQAQSKREICSNLTAPGMFDLHSLNDITEMISSSGMSGVIRKQFPPMIGVVRVKSRVTHFGEPGIANPFPFVFHIVVVDSSSVVEIAFFGSMCARYFPTVEEGDVIQVRGYSVSVSKPEENDDEGATEILFFFEHDSEGQVLHIPATYWKMLGAMEVLWNPPALERGSDYKRAIRLQSPSPPPIWLQCDFVTASKTQTYTAEMMGNNGRFDFVGVLSYVGKICRRRKRKRVSGDEDDSDAGEESGPVAEYRWVKAVDEDSSNELIILLHDCSEPQQFHNLKAGDTVMLTKLQWVFEDDDETHADLKTDVDDHVFGAQYAASGSFTVLRVNSAVSAFEDSQEQCSTILKFAKKLMANAKVREQSITGESWLEGDVIKKYHPPQPQGVQAADYRDISTTLGWQVYQFSELSSIYKKLETLEHQRVAVIGRLLSIPTLHCEDAETASLQCSTAAFEIEFGDSTETAHSQKARLRANPILRNPNQQALPEKAAARDISSLNGTMSKAMKCLLEMLSPVIVDEVIADASRNVGGGGKRKRKKHKKNKKLALTTDPAGDGDERTHSGATTSPVLAPVGAHAVVHPAVIAEPPTVPSSPTLTPAFLERWLTKGNRVFLFSTHLYRTQAGVIDVEIDAILPYALEV